MMSETAEHKIVLLFTPQRMLTDHVVLQSLHIHKNGRSVDYICNELNHAELRRYYSEVNSLVKSTLPLFRQEAIDERISAIKKKHAVQRAGISFDTYFATSMLREIHSVFERLKPAFPSLKWYHKIKAGDKFKTGPCTMQTIRPLLKFEVVRKDDNLSLQTIIIINDVKSSVIISETLLR